MSILEKILPESDLTKLNNIRNILFNMPVPFSMTTQDFDTFWPTIDNV